MTGRGKHDYGAISEEVVVTGNFDISIAFERVQVRRMVDTELARARPRCSVHFAASDHDTRIRQRGESPGMVKVQVL